MREVITPAVQGMTADGVPYSGFLYAGVMLDAQGAPRVLEFNCRLGDPETQPIVVRLGRVTGRWGWTIHAWVLMTTHYHLAVETELGALSAGMRELNGGHARRFNERHGRRGHLFGSRFTAESITTDEYFEAACAYVLANPVRAGLCASPENWRWGGLGTPTPRR